jgi:hypothetical protein
LFSLFLFSILLYSLSLSSIFFSFVSLPLKWCLCLFQILSKCHPLSLLFSWSSPGIYKG